MSKASEIRRKRKLHRGIGKKAETYLQMMQRTAMRAIQRITQEVGRENIKLVAETAFSISIETSSVKVRDILLAEGYKEIQRGEFVHGKMRLSDFASMGAVISLVPKSDLESLTMKAEYKFDSNAWYASAAEKKTKELKKD